MTTDTVLTDQQTQDAWDSLSDAVGHEGFRVVHYSFARAIEQAVLQSPQVQALLKDAARYRFCRSQTSPAQIHIHGVELGLAGEHLDEAMDGEMEAWKS